MSKFTSILLSAFSTFKLHPEDYCDIETIDGPYNIVFANGSIMTFIKYEGLTSVISVSEFDVMIDSLTRETNSFFLNSGHKIACVFRKDLDTYHLLEKTEQLQKATAHRLKLDVGDLIDENISLYEKGVYNEETWFALITQPSVLDKIEMTAVMEEREKFNYPALKHSQNVINQLDILRAKHNTFVDKFFGTLTNKRFFARCRLVNVLESINFIKRQINPQNVGSRWVPVLPLGNQVAEQLKLKDYSTMALWPTDNDPHDMSYLFPAKLSRQILGGTTIENLGTKDGYPQNTLKVGEYLYSSIYMDTGPSLPRSFNALFGAFNKSVTNDDERGRVAMPYTISFMLTGDALSTMMLKRALAMFLKTVPPFTNRNLAYSLEQLMRYRKNEHAVVGLQISAMTWVRDTANAPKILRERKTYMKSTFENWGSSTAKDNTGDNVMLWRSSVLGLTQDHVGTVSAAPLIHAYSLLPFTRPATPFNNGTILHRTMDGKIMQLEKFSPQMNTWVTIITGTPGSGKSVLMNNMLLETCLMPGLSRLPFITIIDKGISATGFIDLLRDRLPEEYRHLVVAKRLRKDKSHAINPFDIKVGLTRPLEGERSQIINFLNTLLTPKELDRPYEGTASFCGTLVDMAFELYQDTGANSQPKMYRHHYSKELDNLLQEYRVLNYRTYYEKDLYGREIEQYDYNTYDPISLYALVRKLHYLGERSPVERDRIRLWRARDLAHRYAMPILPDMINIINTPEIQQIYRNSVSLNETLPQFAIRQINSLIANYPCFCNYTEFDVDTARVVALDLQDVIDNRDRMQTALFYQVARMVGVKKISLSEDDVTPERIPALFLDYYKTRLKEINSDRKTIAYDELHNAREDFATMSQIAVDCREGRKWGLELLLASHNFPDFSYKGETAEKSIDLLGFATNICVCSEPTDESLELFKKNVTTNAAVIEEFSKIGLSKQGLTYMSYYKMKTGKYNTYITCQVGDKRLWSLTTDQKDRALRTAMYTLVSDKKKAIAALAYNFGGGASERIAEQAELLTSEKEVREMIDTMAKQALYNYESYCDHRDKQLRLLNGGS